MLWISLIAGYSRSISSDTYDTAGNLRSSVSNNDNGLYVSYAYDTLNRLQTVSDDSVASSIPGKNNRISLTAGIELVGWGHDEQERDEAVDRSLGGIGGETVYLSLYFAGSRQAVRFR